MTRPGTISNALSLPDGSHVYLDAVEVCKIRAGENAPYFAIQECFSRDDRIVVLTQPNPLLRLGQTVDVEGDLTTLDSGDRAITDVTVWGYTDSSGTLLYHGPLIKGIDAPTPWDYKVDLTVACSASRSATRARSDSMPPGEVSASSSAEVVPCAAIADAKAQSLGTVVVIRCHPVSSGGTGSFILGEDGNTDTLTVNYTGTVNQTSRVCVVSGTIDTTDGTDRVLDVDSGPNYNVQESFQGSIVTAPQGSLAWAKTWADGHTFATGDITGKIVTRNWTDYLYIEEDSRVCGIRVEKTAHGHVKGERVDVVGTLATNANGERYIAATAITQNGSGTLNPLGMNNKLLGGGDFFFDGLTSGQRGVTGSKDFNNIGLLVRTWGRVSAVDSGNPPLWFQIDDGSNVTTKVAYPPFAYALNDYAAITGISSCEADTNGDLQRVLLPQPLTCTINQAQGQNDPALTSPVNFTVAFGEPVYGFTADDVSISGTATRTGSPVVTPIGTDGTQYNVAVDGFTGCGTVIATVPAGGAQNDTGVWNYAATYTDNSINYIGNVIYVKPGGSGDQSGKDWNNAKPTIQAGLNATDTYHQTQVWVTKGTYSERITLKSGVALYGGFAGTEAQLSERPTFQRAQPDTNESIIDGGKAGSVVTIPSNATSATMIDGFTIRNGTGTLVSGSNYYGGGIYCPSGATGSPVVSHNKIIWNAVSYAGGGIYIGGGSPLITRNVITGNEASSYGGGVYVAPGATVSNNVITANGAQYGGGIYCRSSQVVNNTVVANDGREGGGICCGTSDVIKANVVAFNCSGITNIQGGMNSTVTYNCLCGNRIYGVDLDYIASSATNITSDPKLVGVDQSKLDNLTSLPDVRIQGNSPCIDAITDGTLRDTIDINGQLRNIGNYADIGAYESDGSSYTIPYRIYRVIGSGGNDNNDGSDWTTNAMATIQGAINRAAQTGGDVWVKTSITFNERITLHPFVYLIGSCSTSTTVRPSHLSTSGLTVIDGQSQGRVVTIRGGYRTNLIDNFMITHGSIAGNGAGVICSNASPVIRYNRIRNNTASGSPSYGGGIYCYYGAPIIEGNYIGEQSAGNSALYGAGLYSYCSIVTIARNAIWYNTSGCSQGGGIYAIANLADNYGTVLIENNFIKGNVTSDAGCGMYISGCGNYSNSLIVAYNTITGNGSTYSASGAVYLVSPDYIVFADNIVSSNNLNGNTYGIRKSGGASISITRNCVYSNGGTDYSTGITHSTDINVSPQLGTMWWLQSGSPCRTNASPPGYTTSIDIDGESRKMGAVYDIGCDEYTE